jgi:hypothetical protein
MSELTKMNKLLAPAVALALLMGCTGKEEEPVVPPVKKSIAPTRAPGPTPSPTKTAQATTPPTSSSVPPPPAPVRAPTQVSGKGTPAVSGGDDTAAEVLQKAQSALSFETAYNATSDFKGRVETIYKISDLNTPEAIATLGRLFAAETKPELKTEIVDSLMDFDGLDDKKAAILAAAAAPGQDKDVRETAIDGLTDIDPRKAIPILQGLVNDPDEDIRDAAKDALETAQEELKNPQ